MIRLLTAAAVATMLATPVWAQSVSPGDRSDTMQNQGLNQGQSQSSPGVPGSPVPGSPGLSGQAPADCLPNDPRPACQTAQLPSQVPAMGGSTVTPPAERSQGSWGNQGSGSSGSGSSGSGSSGPA